MTEPNDVAPVVSDTGRQAFDDAYNAVVAQHTMTTATDGTITCTCGDTGTVAIDMMGHWGDEATRAGEAAQAAVQ